MTYQLSSSSGTFAITGFVFFSNKIHHITHEGFLVRKKKKLLLVSKYVLLYPLYYSVISFLCFSSPSKPEEGWYGLQPAEVLF